MNALESIISIAGLPAIGVAALLTYYFDRRKAAEDRRAADRREHYRNVILCLKNLRDGHADHVDLLRFEYAFLWLYAPNGVVQAAGALLDKISAGGVADDLRPLINELIVQMRRDMGFGRAGIVPSRHF